MPEQNSNPQGSTKSSKNQSNPLFGKRKWVKLWVNEWLDGTTRFEMSDAQRAFWIDLLALAGRSRFPGKICAGEVNGVPVGYPLNKYQALMAEPIDVWQTLSLFERVGKIRLVVTSEAPVKLVMVELLNWDRYQSDLDAQAERARNYRSRKRQRHAASHAASRDASRGVTVVEVEVEEEVEAAAAAATTLTPSNHPLWAELSGKVGPESLPYELVELCEKMYSTRGSQSLYDFMGACMDTWESRGHGIPRLFAQAKSALAVTAPEKAEPSTPPAKPITFLPEMPFRPKGVDHD